MARKSSMSLISHFDLLDAFDPVRKDFARTAYAGLMLDLTDVMTELDGVIARSKLVVTPTLSSEVPLVYSDRQKVEMTYRGRAPESGWPRK